MKRFNGFSLMEMMVVLLITSIIAAASAPMINKKLVQNAASESSPWAWVGTNGNAAFNMNSADVVAMIGATTPPSTVKNGLYIKTPLDKPQISFGSGGSDFKSALSVSRDSIWLSGESSGETVDSVAMGIKAKSGNAGVSMGYSSNAVNAGIAIGYDANATGGSGAISIGMGSVANGTYTPIAIGNSTTASGGYSLAAGSTATASGDFSVAIGSDTTANNTSATAIGDETKAYGSYSSAYGANVRAEGDGSVALGSNTKATGGSAIAIGRSTEATGGSATAIGYLSYASGEKALVIGYNAHATNENSIAIGKHAKSSGVGSIAIGTTPVLGWNLNSSANAPENYAIAIGANCSANAASAVAIGNGSRVSNEASVALGCVAKSSGTDAVAFGDHANSTEEGAIAIGAKTLSESTHAISIGYGATVERAAQGGMAIGTGASASGGMYATAIGASASSAYEHSTAIGAGAAANMSNQIVLGTAEDTVYIPGRLAVQGASVLGIDNVKTYINMENSDNPRLLRVDGNEVTANQNYIYRDQTMFNGYGQSDRRLKNVGEMFKSGLAEIKKLEVFNYTFKSDEKKTPRVGVMAQDLKKIFPNAVWKGEDGFYLIRTEDIFYALVNAVKELDMKIETLVSKQKKIDVLEKEIKSLKAENISIKKRLDLIEKKLK